MINKLTGEPVSEEMQNVLKRLAANETVPESEIYALKEIKEANSCISSSKPTIELKNRTGIQLGVYNRLQNMGSAVTKSDGAVSFSGEIRREKRLDIVIGLPASGKSSALVEPISELYKSRVIDSDEAKKLLPEFNNGWGAGVVHKESQLISDRQLSAALKAGENITYPRVGGDSSELLSIISTAKSQGYSVYVHYNELDRNKALGRLLNRFLETGRYIKPELVTKYGSGINNTYEQAKNATSLIDGFSKWSKLDKDKFLAHTEQYDNLNSLKTNIRYPSDDLTLREMRFNSVNFKDGGTTGRREAFAQSAARTPHIQSERSLTHIVISNGDKTAALTPEKMTETEMKNICTNRLGMTEYQAEKAVAKSQKIDRQVKSKIEERTVGKDGVSQSIDIERTSQNGFTLTLGGKSKTYNFSTINVADKISRDFNIPKENSVHIIDKAKKQSLLQNKIHNSLKKQPAAPTFPKLKLNESKGLKH